VTGLRSEDEQMMNSGELKKSANELQISVGLLPQINERLTICKQNSVKGVE
jgi:hypothetical protein